MRSSRRYGDGPWPTSTLRKDHQDLGLDKMKVHTLTMQIFFSKACYSYQQKYLLTRSFYFFLPLTASTTPATTRATILLERYYRPPYRSKIYVIIELLLLLLLTRSGVTKGMFGAPAATFSIPIGIVIQKRILLNSIVHLIYVNNALYNLVSPGNFMKFC